MKIKDLPEDTNLQTIPVILPEEVWKNSSLPMYNIPKDTPIYIFKVG